MEKNHIQLAAPKLFMILLGCRPPGRFTEQHDIFFTIGESLKAIIPEILSFWPEAKGRIHIDAWREVTRVDGYQIEVFPADLTPATTEKALFFLNLGGYKPGEFDELHYMMLTVAGIRAEAIKTGKETAFYKHTGFAGAVSHIDDKYGVAVDDVYEMEDILPEKVKQKYTLRISPAADKPADKLHLGYLPLKNIK